MSEYINIGPCPPEEDAVQITEGSERMRADCNRYIAKLRQWFGPEPDGARLTIKGFNHDFGTYYEVICRYDPDNPGSVRYAFDCESGGPERWDSTREQHDSDSVDKRAGSPTESVLDQYRPGPAVPGVPQQDTEWDGRT